MRVIGPMIGSNEEDMSKTKLEIHDQGSSEDELTVPNVKSELGEIMSDLNNIMEEFDEIRSDYDDITKEPESMFDESKLEVKSVKDISDTYIEAIGRFLLEIRIKNSTNHQKENNKICSNGSKEELSLKKNNSDDQISNRKIRDSELKIEFQLTKKNSNETKGQLREIGLDTQIKSIEFERNENMNSCVEEVNIKNEISRMQMKIQCKERDLRYLYLNEEGISMDILPNMEDYSNEILRSENKNARSNQKQKRNLREGEKICVKNKNAWSEIVRNEECTRNEECSNLPQVFEVFEESTFIVRSWKFASNQRKQFKCDKITNQSRKSWMEMPKRLGLIIRRLEMKIRNEKMKTRNSWMEIPRKTEIIPEMDWVRIMIHGPRCRNLSQNQSRLSIGRLINGMRNIRILEEKSSNGRNSNLMNEKAAWFMNQSKLSNIEKLMMSNENDDDTVGRVTYNQPNEKIIGTIMKDMSTLELRAICNGMANCQIKIVEN